jgi:outer membrane protein OmpA-like peptidoglycan-associated protein
MEQMTSKASRGLAFTFGLLLACAPAALAQDPNMVPQGTPTAMTRSVAVGEKAEVEGTIVNRDPDSITVRDERGYETLVVLNDQMSVKSKGGFFRRGKNYDVTSLLTGLIVEVEGRGNAQGQLVANKIRFDKDDLKVARSIDTRVNPVEGRLSVVEAENDTLAGQVDELNAVSREIRAEASRANAEADRANAGVSLTNERISSLDDYDVQGETTVFFKVNSARLTPEGMADLDEIARQAAAMKGYIIEVAGFTDATGSVEKNRRLSQQRADAVVRYLQENHEIPLRRMVTPFGFGETRFIADNESREGREQNRRVEVKVLVSRGITQTPDLGQAGAIDTTTP